MTNTSTSPRRISPGAFAHFPVLAGVLAMALLVASGCRSNRGPGPDAPLRDAAEWISGMWTATLNAEATEQGVAPMNVPLALEAGALEAGNASLSGSIAGVDFVDGSMSTEPETSISFATGAITAQGAVGEELTVEGPLTWTATLQNGRLWGQVTGADGRTARWVATKN